MNDQTWCSPVTKPNFKTKNGFVDLTLDQWIEFNEMRGTPELNEKYADYRKLLDDNTNKFIIIPWRIRDLFYKNLDKSPEKQLTANQNECLLEIFQQVGYESRLYTELEKDFTEIQTEMIVSGILIPGDTQPFVIDPREPVPASQVQESYKEPTMTPASDDYEQKIYTI